MLNPRYYFVYSDHLTPNGTMVIGISRPCVHARTAIRKYLKKRWEEELDIPYDDDDIAIWTIADDDGDFFMGIVDADNSGNLIEEY